MDWGWKGQQITPRLRDHCNKVSTTFLSPTANKGEEEEAGVGPQCEELLGRGAEAFSPPLCFSHLTCCEAKETVAFGEALKGLESKKVEGLPENYRLVV